MAADMLRNASGLLNYSTTVFLRPAVNSLSAASWMLIMMLSSVLSSVALIFLLYGILTARNSRKASGVYVAHLLFNHLFTCAFGNPIYIAELYLSFIGAEESINCPAWMFFRRGFIQTDMWASLFLALNRLNAVHFPHRYKWWTKTYSVAAVVSLSWLLGIGCNLPIMFGYGGRYGKMPPWNTCLMKATSDVWTTVVGTLGFYFPVTATGVIYGGMFFLSTARRVVVGRIGKKEKKAKMADTLAASYLFYLVCYLPDAIITFKFPFLKANATAVMTEIGLQLIGACGNPVIFYAMNQEYRTTTRNLLKKTYRKIVPVPKVQHSGGTDTSTSPIQLATSLTSKGNP